MKAPRKRSHGNLPLTLLAGLLLLAAVACDDPAGEAAAAATASPSAEADASADLGAYCGTICERTTRCGLELAKREAGSLDEKLVAEMEKDQKAETDRCASACSKQPLGDDQRFQLERAQICLGKTDCDELSECMAAL